MMIEEIHKSPCYGYVVETGAGSIISNSLLSVSGASRTIEACFTPYSKYHVESTLNMDLSNIRAISKEYAQILSGLALSGPRAKYLFETNENFFVLTSTFQISSNPNVSSHGWMSLTTPLRDEPNFYHFTLPQLTHDMDVSEYRKDMFRLVGELGISVIYRNMVNKIDLMYLDVCIEDGEYSYLDTIKSILATPDDMAVVFYPNGETDRLEPICRSSDNILIFKGSFNPPHYGHMEMMRIVEKELGVDGSFVISLDTFGKGLVDPKDILHRVKMINDLGYRVILNKKPLFRDFINLFNNRMNKLAKLHFMMGEDTAIRFVQVTPKDIELSATRVEDGQTYTQECVYHVFKRNVDAILPKKFKIYGPSADTSSTDIRKNLNFEYLDDKTINYILKNKLYQTEKNYV